MGANFVSNKSELLSKMRSNKQRALAAMGLMAITITGMNIDASGRVDTGLMKGSVGSQQIDENSLAHGIGVHYGIFQEVGTSRGITPGNFIRNNFNNHKSVYEDIALKHLSQGF